jgi:thioesterase domain-containing protein/NADP-dependent 3-hydroxy acid dehydrogenase YdfG/acyl carrier protein
MRSLLTAGESVSSKTVRQFLELLAVHGLSSTAIRPAFGMAELGSGVTYYLPTSENPVRVRHVDRTHLDGALRLVEPSDPRAASFTSLGPVIPSARMRVVDEYDRVQPENTIGRLQIGGGPVCLGYYKNPEANREVFAGEGWFNTGDRGFLSGGELYLTGRDKETLVINGANYHNSEIEAAVEVVPGVRVSFTAACAVRDAAHGERLAIFFCAEAVDDAALRATFAEVQNGISRKTGVKVDYLLPVSPRDIPKTAIGKIQRKELVKRFERGDFGALVRRVDVLLQNERTLPDWFLRPSFGAKALPSQIELGERRRVLLLEDEYGLAAYVRAFLGDLGLAVTSVPAGAEVPVMPPAVTDVVDLSDYGPLGAVNDAGGRDTGARAQGRIVELAHHVSSRSAAAADSRKLRYCVVASHSQAAVPEDSVDPARAMVPAVLAALSQEHAVAGAHVDAPFVRGAYALAEVARFVVAECLARSRDEEVVYRSTQRFVRAFERVKWPESAPAEATLERGALYLITGGLGGVGAELSRFLLSRFGVELVVVGRAPVQGAGADPARRAVLADLERRGVVVYEAADVTDAASLKDALARAEARAGKRVSGAFHLASAYHEQPLARETATSLDTLIAPKLHGAEAVHAALADRDAFVVCFTSLAGVSSGAGIGAYAAANRLVDAFCHEQRRRGRASYSLSWSVWKGLGIGADAPVQALRAKGYQPISPAKGFVSLLAVLGQGPSHFLVGVDPAHPALACRVEAPARAAHTLLAAVVPREGATPELPAAFDDCGHPVPLELRVLARGPLTAEGTLDRDAALAVLRGRANGVARSPSTPLQKQLAAIWSDLLGVDSVSIDDSFFDLGGTSLLSVRLFAEIERLFGVGLPLATLFRAPTIEALCALLEAEHSVEEARSLRLLSPREASVALHLIHDVDGATDPFQPLADALDGSVRVYAIGPHAEGSFPVLHTRVEEMAEYYVGKIRRAQPEGPYHVGGLGIGGVLAHAVACRLQAGGERVGLVALLDSMDSAWRPGSSTGRSGIFRKIDVGFAQYLKTGTARISNALTRTGMEYARVKLLRHYVDRGERPPWFLEHIPLETVYRFAVSEYVAERFEGRVTLLRATAGTPADATDIPAREQCPDPYFGWTFRATSGVAVHDVAGGHRTLLDAAHVAATARALKRALGLECHDVAAAS